jgi:hypothetical protein
MVIYIREVGKMIKKKEKEHILIKRVINMREVGKMV